LVEWLLWRRSLLCALAGRHHSSEWADAAHCRCIEIVQVQITQAGSLAHTACLGCCALLDFDTIEPGVAVRKSTLGAGRAGPWRPHIVAGVGCLADLDSGWLDPRGTKLIVHDIIAIFADQGVVACLVISIVVDCVRRLVRILLVVRFPALYGDRDLLFRHPTRFWACGLVHMPPVRAFGCRWANP
jgi:hypothetical protein